ncbi:MAG: PorV/PorQ family protein [Bacteroidota bacterium]|nr:PorV/PorQ family protein [Bacteroidota bacterium]
MFIKITKIFFLLLFIVLIFFVDIVFAGRGDKAGTAAASQLLIPIGARSVAMGGSSLATITGIEAMYWNPAGLARSQHSFSSMFSHMSYLANINVEYLAVSTTLSSIGHIGFSIKSLGIGEIDITSEDYPDGTGEVTSPAFYTFGAAFSRQVSDRISVGASAQYVYEKMAEVSASAFAFNAGVQYTGIGGIDGLSVGAAVKNVGGKLKFDGSGLLREASITDSERKNSMMKIESESHDLPSTIEVGLGYNRKFLGNGWITLTSVFQNNNYSDDEYKFGIEYFNEFISIRSGVSVAAQSGAGENIFGPSIGFGVNRVINDIKITVDYAFRFVQYFNGNHVFCIILEV